MVFIHREIRVKRIALSKLVNRAGGHEDREADTGTISGHASEHPSRSNEDLGIREHIDPATLLIKVGITEKIPEADVVPSEEGETRGVVEKSGGIVRNRYVCPSESDGPGPHPGEVGGYRPGGNLTEKKQKHEEEEKSGRPIPEHSYSFPPLTRGHSH